jgi:hypothetical protein
MSLIPGTSSCSISPLSTVRRAAFMQRERIGKTGYAQDPEDLRIVDSQMELTSEVEAAIQGTDQNAQGGGVDERRPTEVDGDGGRSPNEEGLELLVQPRGYGKIQLPRDDQGGQE